MSSRLALTLVAASLCAGAAHAQTAPKNKSYATVLMGIDKASFDCAGATPCDTKDKFVKLTLGAEVGMGFAAEVGFSNYGRAKVGTGSTTANAGTAMAAYRYGIINDVSATARLGVAYVRTTQRNGGNEEFKGSIQPVAGLSVQYAITPQIEAVVGAEFTRAKDINDNKANITAFGIGASGRF
jgi:opacity protein-like surface antigen